MQSFIIALFLASLTIVYVLEPLLDAQEQEEQEEVIIAEPIKPVEVNYDYKIDLRPDFIVVYSRGGNIDTIPHGRLEYFFERDNM